MAGRKQDSKPDLRDCQVTDYSHYCLKHNQPWSACNQMANGNLCHICLQWHTGPRCDEKPEEK